jgi:hypothetical protein
VILFPSIVGKCIGACWRNVPCHSVCKDKFGYKCEWAFCMWCYVKDTVFVPPVSAADIPDLRVTEEWRLLPGHAGQCLGGTEVLD